MLTVTFHLTVTNASLRSNVPLAPAPNERELQPSGDRPEHDDADDEHASADEAVRSSEETHEAEPDR